MLRYKTDLLGLFSHKSSHLFHLPSKKERLKNKESYWQYSTSLCTMEDLQHKPSTGLCMLSPMDYASQVNHQALRVCVVVVCTTTCSVHFAEALSGG